ncbi:cold shock domain-containing protein E1-like isoform X1 [Haliotis cracherodii]|uniref:cold shock domain-containing protein E1-like isoform X1 n=1 Tax=Haliotis cracherodii TaxID=6455 RepID=UPI0039E9F989
MSVRKMNSPQWKKFQPPAQDPAIMSFHQGPNIVSSYNNIPTSGNNGLRETGIIDKLQHSYGFIQCCDREARLFFHFSEYSGDIDTMKIGDAVEFQMSYDRRTGKPIAVTVVKVDNSMVTTEILSDERFVGSIVQVAKPSHAKNGTVVNTQDGLGRVTYEHNGECFFLPYGLEDLSDSGVKLKPGDQVMFHIATDKRNGNIRARQIEMLQPPSQQRFQGVVCSMKETFGFIERADVVREIFFHYSEFKDNINELILGDDVEFSVQNRNGKEVAVDISRLPEGTVIFEDIGLDMIQGKVLKTLKNGNNRRQSDPLGGRIIYETPKGTMDIPFGDKDQKGDYTLQQGDTVEFNIATDRRDKLQRATNIQLTEETFDTVGEVRETGLVVSLKEGYGFIQCADREARMFFHFSELLDPTYAVNVQDDLEFTVAQDPSASNRQIAIRIKHLPKGSVSFLTIHNEKYIGTVDREPATHKTQAKNKEQEGGNVVFDYEGTIQSITYFTKDLVEMKQAPRYGDKVEFSIGEQKSNNKRQAVNVRVVLRNITGRCQGFIATLKDNYGFIENAEHDKEVFFHYSSFDKDANDLELGDEVEYILARKSSKLSAENIRKLPKGTVAPEEMMRDQGILQGKIIRPMRIVNPEQDEYCGLVQVREEDDPSMVTYPYGITSLADKRDFLQKGDIVKFNVAIVKSSGSHRAVNIAALRKYVRARVDSVKGQFGFIQYEVEEGKKLFFHMTEVHDGAEIQPGDEVEFVVVQNQRNGKYSACSLRKITDRQRPERLISRLKSMSDEVGQRMMIIRAPKGPDNTKGFIQPRLPWTPTV